MKILHLSVKKEYFDQINSGEKKWEYRLMKPYWSTRLVQKQFDLIRISNGYPKRSDPDRTIERPWKGYEMVTILHKEFANVPKKVFAIRVND